MKNTENTSEEMQIILEKIDAVAASTLILLDKNLSELGIEEDEMRNTLKYAIAVKMQEKIILTQKK